MFKIKINYIKIECAGNSDTIIEKCFLDIEQYKTYVLTGSNGCGKTTLTLALTNLLNKNIYKIDGSVFFEGTDLLNCKPDILNTIRQTSIKYVFQDPVNSFNPLMKLNYYFQLLNVTITEINSLLEFFLLPSFDVIKKLYPHEISVGMAQRIAIILALLAKPKLIIFDEPNSGLDLASSNILLEAINNFTSEGSASLIVTQDALFAQKAAGEILYMKNKTITHTPRNTEFINSSPDSL